MEKAKLQPFQIGVEEKPSEATLPSHLPYTSRPSSAFKAVHVHHSLIRSFGVQGGPKKPVMNGDEITPSRVVTPVTHV